MSKLEDKRRAELEKAIELFADKTQEEANDYLKKEVKLQQLSKAMMSAYIKKYADSEEEIKWVKGEFKKASYKEEVKKNRTVCTDAKGGVVHKLNKEGKVIPKYVYVEAFGQEKYPKFNLSGARKEFIKHFNIELKDSGFTPKEKRTEKIFDVFDGLFD